MNLDRVATSMRNSRDTVLARCLKDCMRGMSDNDPGCQSIGVLAACMFIASEQENADSDTLRLFALLAMPLGFSVVPCSRVAHLNRLKDERPSKPRRENMIFNFFL